MSLNGVINGRQKKNQDSVLTHTVRGSLGAKAGSGGARQGRLRGGGWHGTLPGLACLALRARLAAERRPLPPTLQVQPVPGTSVSVLGVFDG